MWANQDEARSDFVLAAATALFGPLVLLFVLRILPALGRGIVGVFVVPALTFAITGLVPLLLARYRGEGAEAFGLDAPREAIGFGLLASLPVVVFGVLSQWSSGGTLTEALAGSLVFAVSGDALDVAGSLLGLAAAAAGVILLYPFLTVKARNGFAHNEVSMLEALRTYGIGAAAIGFVVGLLLTPTDEVSFLAAALAPAAVVALVLIVDRVVPPGAITTRATVLAPAIVALVLGLDIFRGAFLVTLRSGALAAGFVVAVAILVETRRHAWAVVPLVVAVVIYPSPLRPI